MDKTIAKSLFAGMLVMVAGCVTGEDFVPPPPKPLTVIHTEPQKPTSESNAKSDASAVAPVVDEAPKRRAKARDKKQPVSPAAVRKVALVVQNHADPGAGIPFMALTDALMAKLSGCGLQVINPYNAIGVNLNRTAAGEKMPEVSAMEIARKLKADGAITASVLEFLDSTSDTTHQYSIRVVLNLADAWSGATVVEGETVEKSSPYYANDLVRRKKPKLLNDLMYSAADKCAAKLKKNPNLLNWKPTPPPPPKPLPPPPDDPWLTLSDIDGVVQEHIDSMRADPVFRDNYDTAQAAIDHIPLVVVGGLVDLTNGKSPTADLDNFLASASQNVRITLLRTRLVDAKDDSVITEMTDRIVKNGKSPTEDGALMAVLKQHGSPDFFMVGDIKYFHEKKAHKYRIRLALHNLHTGKIVWEDFKDVSKNTGVSK